MRSTSSRPSGVLRSMHIVRLLRLLRRNVAPTDRPSGSIIVGVDVRPDSPAGGSTFTTSAPSRANSCVAYGSACICSSASTRTPSSGRSPDVMKYTISQRHSCSGHGSVRPADETVTRTGTDVPYGPGVVAVRSVCVFCGSSSPAGGPYRAAAQELGALLAARGIELVYG